MLGQDALGPGWMGATECDEPDRIGIGQGRGNFLDKKKPSPYVLLLLCGPLALFSLDYMPRIYGLF